MRHTPTGTRDTGLTFTRHDLTQFSGFRLLGKIHEGSADDTQTHVQAFGAADTGDWNQARCAAAAECGTAGVRCLG